ncbi:MAG: CHASE2 domain-containing protein [Cyclobacteriaceae bacterium]|nr:CHASE2 domain-containing protein [Cyclobacteriaceae bacterium]
MRLSIKELVFGLLIVCSFCKTKSQDVSQKITFQHQKTKIKELVLVNARDANRCEMGSIIQLISSCNPKVIGVNFLFIGDKNAYCDSILLESIKKADNVMLIEGFENGQHAKSESKFKEVSFLSALNGFLQNDSGKVDGYYSLIDHRGKWEVSFPFLLALQYDKSKSAELSSTLSPVKHPIKIYHELSEFEIFDNYIETTNCAIFENRIVLIGYLGPKYEDIFEVVASGKSGERVYGTVILANMLLDILMNVE